MREFPPPDFGIGQLAACKVNGCIGTAVGLPDRTPDFPFVSVTLEVSNSLDRT
jgi:hypothetical protein